MSRQCCGSGAAFGCTELGACSVTGFYDVSLAGVNTGDTLVWSGTTLIPSGNTGDSICFHIAAGDGITIEGVGSTLDPLTITGTGGAGGTAFTLDPDLNNLATLTDDILMVTDRPTAFASSAPPPVDGTQDGDTHIDVSAGNVHTWDENTSAWVVTDSWIPSQADVHTKSWEVTGAGGVTTGAPVWRVEADSTIAKFEFYHPVTPVSGVTQVTVGEATVEWVVNGVLDESFTWDFAVDGAHKEVVPAATALLDGDEVFFRVTSLTNKAAAEQWDYPSFVIRYFE